MYSVGDTTKVFLRGESPWAKVTEVHGEMVKVRIINKLFFEYSPEVQAEWTLDEFDKAAPLPRLHNYKKGDELWCEKGEFGEWVPAKNQGAS